MQVKSTAGGHSAILSTFMKLPFVIKIFVLSAFKWSLKTGFVVSSVSLSLSHWYPGSGVVLDCIDS